MLKSLVRLLLLMFSFWLIMSMFVTSFIVVTSPFNHVTCPVQYRIGSVVHTLPDLDFSTKFIPSKDARLLRDETFYTMAENVPPPLMKHEVSTALLAAFARLDKLCQVSYVDMWACSSSLLGTIRHQGFVPWQPCLHLGFHFDDLPKVVSMRYSLEDGTDWLLIKGKNGYYYAQNNFFHFPRIQLDIFNIRDDEVALCSPLDELLQCTYSDSFLYRKEVFDTTDVFPLVKMKFEDTMINVPKNADTCLQQLYGKEYMHKVYDVSCFLTVMNPKTSYVLNQFF